MAQWDGTSILDSFDNDEPLNDAEKPHIWRRNIDIETIINQEPDVSAPVDLTDPEIVATNESDYEQMIEAHEVGLGLNYLLENEDFLAAKKILEDYVQHKRSQAHNFKINSPDYIIARRQIEARVAEEMLTYWENELNRIAALPKPVFVKQQ